MVIDDMFAESIEHQQIKGQGRVFHHTHILEHITGKKVLDVLGIIFMGVETYTLIKHVEDIQHGHITENLLDILIKLTITRIDIFQERIGLCCCFRDGLMELLRGFATTFRRIDELTQGCHDGDPFCQHLILLADLSAQHAFTTLHIDLNVFILPHIERIQFALCSDEYYLIKNTCGIVHTELESVIFRFEDISQHLFEVAVFSLTDIDLISHDILDTGLFE